MDERTASILKLRDAGLSYQVIADQLGTSRGTVWKALKNGNGALAPTRPVPARRVVVHRCATPGCGRELRNERWIYSTHTGLRYCWTGEGCWRWSPAKRQRERTRSQEVITT
jgi:IS30 family transposase